MSNTPAVPSFIFRGHGSAVHALHFFSNNDYLVSGDSDGWIVVWSTATKRSVAAWQGHEGGLMAIQDWGSDRLMSHGRDHFLRVWQLRSQDFSDLSIRLPVDGATPRESRQPWLLHSMAANALNYCAFSKCDEILADSEPLTENSHRPLLIAAPNGLDAGGIDIFQLPSQQRVAKKPSSKDIQTGFESGHVIVNLREGTDTHGWKWRILETCKPHSQPILSLDITPDREYFVSSSADAFIAKYAVPGVSTTQGNTEKTVNTKHAGQQDVKIRDDGKILATAGWDKRVRIYSMKTLKELAVLKWHQEGCYATAFASTQTSSEVAPDEHDQVNNALVTTTIDLLKDKRNNQARDTHWLAAGGKDGKISLWDIY